MIHTLGEKMEFATDVLTAAKSVLCNQQTFEKHRADIDQDYIDSIARARFGLAIASETLHDFVYTQNTYMKLRVHEKASVDQMIFSTKDLCQHAVVKVKTNLIHFVVKQIVQRYGYSCFMDVSSCDQFQLKSWLLQTQGVVSTCDSNALMQYSIHTLTLHTYRNV